MKGGPDFLCVGMQRAATRTLHGFLSLDERFWMPLIKEFHHFNDPNRSREERHGRILSQLPVMRMGGPALAALNAARRVTGRRRVSKSDLSFLQKYRAYLENGCTDTDYMDLFSVCPEGLGTGDITPGYSALDDAEIARIHRLLPDAQILLVIRDPVSRAWSHANMNLRKRLIRKKGMSRRTVLPAMEEAVRSDDYLDTLLSPRVMGKGSPASIFRNWEAFYGERVEVFAFEEVCSSQQAVTDRIAALLGLPSAAPRAAGDGQIVRNRKAELAKVAMGDREREYLVRHFRDELFECRELFGKEKTPGWLEKYGLA